MAVTKISNSGIKTGVLKYDSMLAGNAAYDPAATWLIQRIAGTGSAGTITFSNIPSTYQHLQIRCLIRDTSGGTTTSPIAIRLNSDSNTANYAQHNLYGNGTSAVAVGNTNTDLYVGDWSVNGSATASTAGVGIIDIHDYTSTTKNKTVRTFGGANNNSTSTSFRVNLGSGLWINTNAVTSVSIVNLFSNFSTSSTFALYGFIGA